MMVILNALAPVFVIVALGYLLAKINFASDDVWHALDHISFYVLFPALLMRTLAKANLDSVGAADFLAVILGAVTIIALILLAAHVLIGDGMTGPSFTSFFQGAIRFQSPIAIALSQVLFGEAGITFTALAVAALIPLVQLYTVTVLIVYGNSDVKPSAEAILRRLMTNPLTLACLAGFILNHTGLPDFAYESLSLLGTAAIGITLLCVGAGLNLRTARKVGPQVAAITGIRLVLMPLLALALSQLFGLSGFGRTVAVIAAGVPASSTAYTMARKMGGDAEFMAQIITLQCVVAAFTLPLFIYLAQNV